MSFLQSQQSQGRSPLYSTHIIDMEQKAIYGYGGYIFIISAPRHVTSVAAIFGGTMAVTR